MRRSSCDATIARSTTGIAVRDPLCPLIAPPPPSSFLPFAPQWLSSGAWLASLAFLTILLVPCACSLSSLPSFDARTHTHTHTRALCTGILEAADAAALGESTDFVSFSAWNDRTAAVVLDHASVGASGFGNVFDALSTSVDNLKAAAAAATAGACAQVRVLIQQEVRTGVRVPTGVV